MPQRLPSSRFTLRSSASATGTSLRKPRLRFADFFSSLWLFIACRRRTLPAADSLNRFFAALDVFVFGIVSRHSRILRRPEQHHHVASVEEGRGLDLPDLLDVLREAHQQVTAPLRMGRLATAEHDRDLDLRALVEEALDVGLLCVVVVDSDLRPELDLLDVDRRLVLPGELRLLLLLVPVLPVVHHPRDRRIGLGSDLDEVEILRVRVLERLLRLLDPHLTAVLVDQPYARDPDRVVDPSLLDRADGLDWPPRPQRALTKLAFSFLVERLELQAAARHPRRPTRFEPPTSAWLRR